MLITVSKYGFTKNQTNVCQVSKLPSDAWPNIMGLESTSHPVSRHQKAPLSIKCVLKGREIYQINGSTKVVDQHSYLIINNEQTYTNSIIDNEVESFSLFFNPDFVKGVLSAMALNDKLLFDGLEPCAYESLQFHQKLYEHDTCVSPYLLQAAGLVQAEFGDPMYYEHMFQALLVQMLQVHKGIHQQLVKLPFLKRSTKVELVKRVFVAKDYLNSFYTQKISLDDLAEQACLSKYYLVRAFKSVCQQTPYQFVTGKRMKVAGHMLLESDRSVERISQAVGYDDHSAFLKLFKKHYAMSPFQFRLANKALSGEDIFESFVCNSVKAKRNKSNL